MREKDLLTRQFLSNRTVFADICNICFHGSRHVIMEDYLHEMSPRAETRSGEWPNSKAVVQERDVVMGCYLQNSQGEEELALVIALEAQTMEDRAMPFRIAMYEVLEYKGQLDALEQLAPRRSGKKGDFISKLQTEQRLVPVASAVVYFGTKPWNTHTRLKQLLKAPGNICPEEFIHDYNTFVFSLCDFTDVQLENSRPALLCVAKALRYGRSKRLLRRKLQEDPDFAKTPSWVVPLISYMLNIDLKMDNEEETTDMCRAAREMIADIRKEGIEEGLNKGIEQGRRESIRNVAAAMALEKSSPERIVAFLMRAFSLSAKTARSYLV